MVLSAGAIECSDSPDIWPSQHQPLSTSHICDSDKTSWERGFNKNFNLEYVYLHISTPSVSIRMCVDPICVNWCKLKTNNRLPIHNAANNGTANGGTHPILN